MVQFAFAHTNSTCLSYFNNKRKIELFQKCRRQLLPEPGGRSGERFHRLRPGRDRQRGRNSESGARRGIL